MSASRLAFVEDAKIGVRLKISALWVVLLFLYAYGDIFGFFKPGQIEDVVSGEISGIDITEGTRSVPFSHARPAVARCG